MRRLSNKTGAITPNTVQKIKYIRSVLYFIILTHSIINAQFWSHSFESSGGGTQLVSLNSVTGPKIIGEGST